MTGCLPFTKLWLVRMVAFKFSVRCFQWPVSILFDVAQKVAHAIAIDVDEFQGARGSSGKEGSKTMLRCLIMEKEEKSEQTRTTRQQDDEERIDAAARLG